MAIGQGSQREPHAGQGSQRERGVPCAGQGSRRERGEPCAGQGSPGARGEPPGALARWAPGLSPPGHSPFSWSGGGHWAPAGHSAFSWTGAPQFTSVVPSTATVQASRSTQTDAPRPVADPLSGPARRPAYDPSASPGSRAEPGLIRLKATCEYDGSALGGWMIQANPEESVQGVLERRLAIYLKRAVPIAGSGRTDAGVSARAQVFHLDVEPSRSPAEMLRALQSGLPPSVRVTAVEAATQDFHARHSCTGKRYSYSLLTRQASPFEVRWCWSLAERQPAGSPDVAFDLAATGDAACSLVGVHDFSNFCVLKPGDPRSPIRHLRSCAVVDEGGGRIRVTVEADRYLYKQMRMMVGTLAQVGMGRLSVEAFRALVLEPQLPSSSGLSEGAGDSRRVRGDGVVTAPGYGLTLEHVFYAQPGEFGTSSVTPASPSCLSLALSCKV